MKYFVSALAGLVEPASTDFEESGGGMFKEAREDGIDLIAHVANHALILESVAPCVDMPPRELRKPARGHR